MMAASRQRQTAERLVAEGRSLAAAGQLHDGASRLRSAVEADPTHGDGQLWLGICEAHLGDTSGALRHLAAAERLMMAEATSPPHPSRGEGEGRAADGPAESIAMAAREGAATAAFEIGNVHYRQARAAEAAAAYRRAIRTNPRAPEPQSNLGVLAYTAGRYLEAARAFEGAIDVAPSFADAYLHLGAARKRLGDPESALIAYGTAARVAPQVSEALRGKALVLRERGRLAEACASLRTALSRAPTEALLHLDLGIAHDYAERREEAMEAYAAAFRLEPHEPTSQVASARYLHGRAAKSMALWRGYDAYNSYLRAAVRAPGGAARLAVDPVGALSSPFRGAELLAIARASSAAKLADAADAADAADPTLPSIVPAPHPGREGAQLTVGFVSSYFRDHNLLRLTRSLFPLLSSRRIRVVLFAESADDASEILRSTQRAVNGFVRLRSMPTARALSAMAAERLHLAVNLNGHHWNAASESVRFGLFGRRTSAVTASYMGYPASTGARNMHYAYVDATAVPPAWARTHFTERLALLPHTYYLNDYAASHAHLPRGAAIAPSADGLSRRCAHLCSLNQLPKLDPALYASWLNALSRAAARGPPCTRLWFLQFPPSGEAHLRREAAAHASPPPRTSLIGLPTVEHGAHLLRAQHCELMVDSRLCNAHTSGTDALWAGTPMLTLPGETQTARVASSLLRAVGLPELAVGSLREFEAAIVDLTAEADSLAARRRSSALGSS